MRLFVLSVVALVLFAGCKRSPTVDASGFDAAKWEKQIQSPSLTGEEFTRLYAQAVAAELKDAKVQITGPRKLSIAFAGGGTAKALLDNVWNEVSKNSARRPEICHRYIAAIVEEKRSQGAPSALPDTNSIVALIRDDVYIRHIEEFAAGSTNPAAQRVVREPLAGDLRIVYASDREGTIMCLAEHDRSALGLDLPALRGLALANLQRILPEIKIRSSGAAFMVVADGNYESSMLLADEFWDDQASKVQGELVAAVPSRAVLIFTGSASVEGMKLMRRTVEKVFDSGDHVISKTLLVRRKGRWELFKD